MTALQKRCQELWRLFAPNSRAGLALVRKTISRKRCAATAVLTARRDPPGKLVGMFIVILNPRVEDFDRCAHQG